MRALKRHPLITGLFLVLFLSGSWYLLSPWWTIRQMTAAIDQHRPERLSDHIDYPLLRENLKQQARQEMSNKVGGAPGQGPAYTMMSAMIDVMIDQAITPGNIEQLAVQAAKEAKAQEGQPSDVKIDRISLSHFDFIIHDGKEDTLRINFERYGLSWKVVGVDLPEGSLMEKKPKLPEPLSSIS